MNRIILSIFSTLLLLAVGQIDRCYSLEKSAFNYPLYDSMDILESKTKYKLKKLGYNDLLMTFFDFPTGFPNEIKNYLYIKLESITNGPNDISLTLCKECIVQKASSTNGTIFTDSVTPSISKKTIQKYRKRYSIKFSLRYFGNRYILTGEIFDHKLNQSNEKIDSSITVIDHHEMSYKISIGAGLVLGKLYGGKIQSLYRWPKVGEGGIKLAFLTSSSEPKTSIVLMPVVDWNIDEIYREIFLWGDTYLTTGLGFQMVGKRNELVFSLGIKQTLFSHMVIFLDTYKAIINLKNKASSSDNSLPLSPINLHLGVGFDF